MQQAPGLVIEDAHIWVDRLTSNSKGWTVHALAGAPIGRSHRSKLGKTKLKEAIDVTKRVLKIPAEYKVGIMAGSDTGFVFSSFSYQQAMVSVN